MSDAPNNHAADNRSDYPNDQPDQLSTLQIKRKKWLSIVGLIIATIAVLYLIWSLIFSGSVNTDNAYVGAETAEITSMVTGQVAAVQVSDTQQVKKGQLLVQIDPQDAKIALAQAVAELGKAQRLYTQSSANSSALNSQILVSSDDINSAKAQVAQAEVNVSRIQQELNRRMTLDASGAISKEELATAQSAFQTAKANLDVAKAVLAQAESKRSAAKSNLAANEAMIKGTSQSNTPDVLVAQARVEQAQLDLQRTEIRAPFDGVVARRSIQVGQRVSPGASMMVIVPISQLYVDANFKESQLEEVRVGQTATLTSDLYGNNVEYRGTVVGFSGGTGAAFALIPAQNATGNWIKVVQRLPVRIKLDPKQLATHPLRVGLSMDVTIDLNSK
ncbi:membrane fusion protein (multidrug efflux system) [Acinetobacter calcoaceticus]|uniref:Membrane fusion protein (Multidrug efflux system) n=1 Tax=Acinetobacter calcoaceticus TaxID=471 RepID=A0A4R1XT10_ACICA|nr:membrane fusion protein (multidrug efflux system) [Acinetobacter calcoaceticus]